MDDVRKTARKLAADAIASGRPLGLYEVLFEDYMDREDPPVRRFRACYRRDT